MGEDIWVAGLAGWVGIYLCGSLSWRWGSVGEDIRVAVLAGSEDIWLAVLVGVEDIWVAVLSSF